MMEKSSEEKMVERLESNWVGKKEAKREEMSVAQMG